MVCELSSWNAYGYFKNCFNFGYMSLTVSLFLTVDTAYTVKCPVKGTFSLLVQHHLIDDESGDGQVKH